MNLAPFSIADRICKIEEKLAPYHATLVGVTKTIDAERIAEAVAAGLQNLGENRVQEMEAKRELLPKVNWHLIGHLQRNKVRYIAPYVHLIHGVESWELLQEIEKEAKKAGRVQACLLQMHIAQEETKFGLSEAELMRLLEKLATTPLPHVEIKGLMGMATFTTDTAQVRGEFQKLNGIYKNLQKQALPATVQMVTLSMGMSADWELALEEGSNMVRIGSALFK